MDAEACHKDPDGNISVFQGNSSFFETVCMIFVLFIMVKIMQLILYWSVYSNFSKKL
jgi:hypothetical protein